MIGQSMRAGDMPLAGSMIKLVSSPEAVIAHVVALKAEEEPAGCRGRRRCSGRDGRARSDQEGQEGRGRRARRKRKGQEEVVQVSGRLSGMPD